jgi:hypothetical protein
METVLRQEGTRFLPMYAPLEKIASMYIAVEKRCGTGDGGRLEVSAWASTPYDYNTPKGVIRKSGMRIHRALKRLVTKKVRRFFKEKANAAQRSNFSGV